MKRLIIVGSPRANGRSAHLAEMLFEANIDEHPEDELFLVPVSEVEVGPCIGCGACQKKTPVTFKDDSGAEKTEDRYRCVFDDDMQTLYDLIDDADEVSVVSPVYFSGAPAPMKCVIDRLQPYFWARLDARKSGSLPEKRPLTLHVIGEGGDPHGFDALVSEVKSSFALADFRLERLLDWVGKITPEGEITAEAREVVFDESGKKARPKLSLSLGDDEPIQDERPRDERGKGGGSAAGRDRTRGGARKQGGKGKQGKGRQL